MSEEFLRLPADISPKGDFQRGWFVATSSQVRLELDQEEDKPLVVHQYPLSQVEEFEARPLVGSGCLEAKIDGETYLLARFNAGALPQYAAAAQFLNAHREKRLKASDLDLPDAGVCPNCGTPYRDSAKVCPKCLNKAAVLARLLSVAKPHRKLLAGGLVLLWGITGLRLVIPQISRLIIDNVLAPEVRDVGLLLFYVGLMASSQVLLEIITVIRSRVMVLLSGRLSLDLRALVYGKIQALSLADIGPRKTGDLMNRVTSDTNRLQRFIQNHVAMGINEGLTFIGIAIILFSHSWQLAALVLFPAPFVTIFVRRVWRRIHRMYRRQWRKEDKATSLLQDVLSGIRVVKAFGQEARESKRFIAFSNEFAEVSAHNERTFNTLFPMVGYVLGLGHFLVLYYGGHLVLGERMGFGELVQFSLYAGMLYGPLRFISFFPRWFTEAMTAAERIFEVIDVEPAVKDREGAVAFPIKGEVKLEKVTFGYQRYDPVVQDIDLHVKPGETIGLVGHSGAGKSTLINLIARFYDVDEGRILIDGVDIRDIDQRSLRSQIGVVLQETFLFSGTIYANIAYAKADATPEEVIKAAKIANAHDFIVRFNDGYDTLVGERGQRLSGGERQRIAIARAILRDPRILILDEATASMDTETEFQIQQALNRLVKDRTTFAIAHRLSTLRAADRLVVLDEGRVAEIGTHDELMAREGIYYKLVMAQREMTALSAVER